ncbi:hypothetical protein PR202_ga03596 [Eleusine coracana subsp. coracana]|uniref:Uncharacterized protein n=1 Tax=Eleusine coracana subsp. coracana TaxID=191504 RepID=A0AAV5BQT0_ELECO|nr:hypothetical protein PR202_ga03596 [Eleusine coracana subsp. coracana]
MVEALVAGALMVISSIAFDTDLYGGSGSDPNCFASYDSSIPASEDDVADDDADTANLAHRRLASYTGHSIATADISAHPTTTGCPRGPSVSSTVRTTTAAAASTRSSRRSAMTRLQQVRPPLTPLFGLQLGLGFSSMAAMATEQVTENWTLRKGAPSSV